MEDYKIIAVEKWEAGVYKSKAEAAEKHGVSPRTFGRWIDKYRELEDQWIDDVQEEVIQQHDEPAYHVAADSNAITIIKLGDGVHLTETITSGHPSFDAVSDIVWAGRGSQESLKEAFAKISLAQQLIDSVDNGSVHIDMDRGTVQVDQNGYSIPLSGRLSHRIIDCAKKNDGSLDRLCRFAEKLAKNPSKDAVDGAYQFIEAMDIEIDEDGDLICFKRVRSDYKDCYSGTFDNTPGGDPVWVPRNQVDEDSSRTCSTGLHVASKAYLSHYFGDRIVLCKVNPENIVSVPNDYYSVTDGGEVKAKMRVCEYQVIADVTESMKDHV